MTAIKDLTNASLFGKIEYNGYTFKPLRQVQAQFVPIYDAHERSVVSLDLKLNVIAVIWDSVRSDHQTEMANIEHRLAEQGKRLIVENIGLSTLLDTASTPDLNFGPKPRLISCKPIGADLCWEVVWEVTWRLPPQCVWGQAIAEGKIISASHEVTYTTNEEGLVQRSINGFIEFYKQRTGTFEPEKVVDKLKVSKLPYFRRVSAQRRFSSARNRIEYSVVDEELSDLAYPDGIIQADVNLDLENQPPGFSRWVGQLSGTLRTAPGFPRSLAADKWLIIMFDTAQKLQASASASKSGFVIPERIRFGSSKFGRTSRFLVTWRMLACLHDILAKTGLWDPVPGTDFVKWSQSMDAAGINNIRGASGVRMVDTETVVNLCENAPPQIEVGLDTGKRWGASGYTQAPLLCPEVTKERSYAFYENKIRGVQSHNAVIHRVMQFFRGGEVPSGDNGGSFPLPLTGVLDDILQFEGKNDNFVIMQGRAVRLKFPPQVPHLEKVQGARVEELARNVDTKVIAGYFDCPMIQTRWAVLYRVKGQIYGIKPANVRELCFTTGESDGR